MKKGEKETFERANGGKRGTRQEKKGIVSDEIVDIGKEEIKETEGYQYIFVYSQTGAV
jgi:hypothetical protein